MLERPFWRYARHFGVAKIDFLFQHVKLLPDIYDRHFGSLFSYKVM